jgi:predicted mannosyl-3-phosphoglycerate phosphatase (HAD superfamily)
MTVHSDVTALAWPSTDVDAQANHKSAAGPANVFSRVFMRSINVDDSLTGAFAHRMMLQTGVCLRQTPCVLYIAVDGLIPPRGKSVAGLDEFTAALDHAGIPAVWVTNRSRLEFDAARRKHAHTHPFIAEGSSGVYLPEGYFHLRPEKTIRLGRFTCVPMAETLPAATNALEALSEETDVPVVALSSLSPRELAQNTGLPQREAELVRQRDFDELFFFAGASEKDIQRFVQAGREKKYELRQHGVMWSLAIGASLKRCIQSLSKLYDRALRYHPAIVGIAKPEESKELFAACDRSILLTDGKDEERSDGSSQAAHGARTKRYSLNDPEVWELILEQIAPEVSKPWK